MELWTVKINQCIKSCKHVAPNLLMMDSRLDVSQHEVKHTELLIRNPLLSRPTFMQFSPVGSECYVLSNEN